MENARLCGGLVSGLLFIFPGFVSIMVLSLLYGWLGHQPIFVAIFWASRRSNRDRFSSGLSNWQTGSPPSFPGNHRSALFFVLAILANSFSLDPPHGSFGGLGGFENSADLAWPCCIPERTSQFPSIGGKCGWDPEDSHRAFAACFGHHSICTTLWCLPVVVCGLIFGWDSIFVRQGIFFSETAMVTFGGAYAVLNYVAQRAVEDYHWLTPQEMLDGLGMAETTPGPLIMVLQFVGLSLPAERRHPSIRCWQAFWVLA